jgi:hypothetical protein
VRRSALPLCRANDPDCRDAFMSDDANQAALLSYRWAVRLVNARWFRIRLLQAVACYGHLAECYPDATLLAPNDMAAQMQPIGRHNQRKLFGDTGLAGYLQRRAGAGQVADDAIDGAAAELDRSGFQDAMARCVPGFGHTVMGGTQTLTNK